MTALLSSFESVIISVVFKVAQVCAVEAIYLGREVLGVSPTGYGKSLIFQLIPDFDLFKVGAVDISLWQAK